jgi:hypothetical protein
VAERSAPGRRALGWAASVRSCVQRAGMGG